GRLPTVDGQAEPVLRYARVPGMAVLQVMFRPAYRHPAVPVADPRAPNPPARRHAGHHVPDLPAGPRPELRDRDGAPGDPAAGAGRLSDRPARPTHLLARSAHNRCKPGFPSSTAKDASVSTGAPGLDT